MKIYVIKKLDRFWKANDFGYTLNLNEAKLFTQPEAFEIVTRPNSDKTMHQVTSNNGIIELMP